MYLHKFLFSIWFCIFRITNAFFRISSAQSNDCIAENLMFSGGQKISERSSTSHSLQQLSLFTDTSSKTCTSPCHSHVGFKSALVSMKPLLDQSFPQKSSVLHFVFSAFSQLVDQELICVSELEGM